MCLFVCMLDNKVYTGKKKTKKKKQDPTFEWEVIFAEWCQKRSTILLLERCCLTNCRDCILL